MRSQKDISSILISEEAVLQKLPSIFTDSIIVDQHFNIVAISQDVLDFLEYSVGEVENKNINFLSSPKDLASELAESLLEGSFEAKRTRLVSKGERRILVSISGFYLGLISHMSGIIILRIKNIDELELINRQLLQSKADMDNFIYRTAHDLRGPLATIRGLVNLVKLRKNNEDLEMLVPLLESHASNLDVKLSSLVYLAQASHESEPPRYKVDFVEIERWLRKIVAQHGLDDFLEFEFEAPDQIFEGPNEILTLSLFSNLLLHILSLPMSQFLNRIVFCVIRDFDCLTVTVGVQGFMVNESSRSLVEQEDLSYLDMVRSPHLINFYAARKIASRLNTRIDFRFFPDSNQIISLTIPLRNREGLRTLR